jgi:hypothetical protein
MARRAEHAGEAAVIDQVALIGTGAMGPKDYSRQIE